MKRSLICPLDQEQQAPRDAYFFELGAADCTPRMRNLVDLLWSEWKEPEQQIVAMNTEGRA